MTRIIYKQIFNKIQAETALLESETLSDSDKEIVKERVRKLKFIFDDLYNAEYIKQRPARKRLQYFIDCGFSYSQTAQKFDTELTIIHKAIARYGTLAKKYLGADTVEMLLENKIDEGFKVAKLVTKKPLIESVLPLDVVKMLPDKEREYELKMYDCIEEIALLKVVSFDYLRKKIGTLNTKRLAHLVYVLSTDDPLYKTEKGLLNKYLSGELMSKSNKDKETSLKELETLFINLDS